MKKRSVTVAGHATSVSVEEPFWEELRAIAKREGVSLAGLIERLDKQRFTKAGGELSEVANLSSAIRLFVLEDVKRRAGASETAAPSSIDSEFL